MHAREIGSLIDHTALKSRLTKLRDELPDKFNQVHFHAYTIQYNDKGEVHHLRHGDNMDDGRPGLPNLDDFVKILKELGLDPFGQRYDREDYALDIKEKYQATFLIATHDIGSLFFDADQVIVLDEGSVIQAGKPEELWEKPKNEKVRAILGQQDDKAI